MQVQAVLRLLSLLVALLCAAAVLLAPGAEGAGSRASASHILVKTEKEAVQLKERLAAGEDFAALAKAHSTCPSSRKGGSLGQFGPGQMVGECVCRGRRPRRPAAPTDPPATTPRLTPVLRAHHWCRAWCFLLLLRCYSRVQRRSLPGGGGCRSWSGQDAVRVASRECGCRALAACHAVRPRAL